MNNSRFKKIYFVFFVPFLCFSCREPAPQIPANKLPESSVVQDMMYLNKKFAELENEEIDHYIDSLGWDMTRAATGLRYHISREGTGELPRKGDAVTIKYSVRLLDGTVCEKLTDVLKTVEIGKGNIERGLEEAVLLLKVSGKGEFILPSHLAFGVSGYKGCVAPWTPVFCEINLIEIN